jgi:hypothetical protein
MKRASGGYAAAVAGIVLAATAACPSRAAEGGYLPVTMARAGIDPATDAMLRARVPSYDPSFPTTLWQGRLTRGVPGRFVLLVAGTATCSRDERVGETCPVLVVAADPAGGTRVLWSGQGCASPTFYAESPDGGWLRTCDRDQRVGG